MDMLPLFPLDVDVDVDEAPPPRAPVPRRRAVPGGYLAFTLDHDRGKARRRFEELHGFPPAEEFADRGLWFVGPEEAAR